MFVSDEGVPSFPSRQDIAEKMFFFFLKELETQEHNPHNPLYLYDLVQCFFYSKTKRYSIDKSWTKLKSTTQTAEVRMN